MAHDKIKQAARERMAITGETYVVARRAVGKAHKMAERCKTQDSESARAEVGQPSDAASLARFNTVPAWQVAEVSKFTEFGALGGATRSAIADAPYTVVAPIDTLAASKFAEIGKAAGAAAADAASLARFNTVPAWQVAEVSKFTEATSIVARWPGY